MVIATEVVEFNGVKFRRYPESTRWPQRCYFTPGQADRARGIKRLHEEVWIAEHGAIPPGSEIHHADFDTLNNDPSNLVCLTVAQHKDVHRERNRANGRRPDQLAHLDRVRPLAAAWHSTPEGIAWHQRHGRAAWDERESVLMVCQQCDATYDSLSRSGHERFCSNRCRAAARRASGVDDESRPCAQCGAEFTANRYSKTRFCGRSCSSTFQHATHRT